MSDYLKGRTLSCPETGGFCELRACLKDGGKYCEWQYQKRELADARARIGRHRCYNAQGGDCSVCGAAILGEPRVERLPVDLAKASEALLKKVNATAEDHDAMNALLQSARATGYLEARHAPASSREAGTRDGGIPSVGTEKPSGQAVQVAAEHFRAALERIAARGVYPVNGGHACATCTAFWHSDPATTRFQSEHHYDRCAYAIARDTLAKNPQEGGGSTPPRSQRPGGTGAGFNSPDGARGAKGAAGTADRAAAESVAGAITRVAEVARTMRARGDALVEGAGDDEEDAWMATLGEHYQLLAGEIDEALAGSPSEVARPDALKEMEARKDGAYEERNRVVAALARMAQRAGFRVGVAKTAIEGWSEDWHSCCYIDLPTGQLSWHFHDSHGPLFEGLPNYIEGWDGHDTPEKYRRLDAYARAVGPDEVIAAYQLGLARGERGREACHEEHVNTLDDLTRVRDECNRRRTSLERLRDYVADNMGDFAGKEELLAEFSTALFGKGDAPGERSPKEKIWWLIETPEGNGFYAAYVADAGLALDNARQWTRHAPDALQFYTEKQATDCARAWGLSPFVVRAHVWVGVEQSPVHRQGCICVACENARQSAGRKP